MRLIDTDIFTSELDFAEADVCEEFPDSYCEFGFSREKIKELLRDIPTVDAVPVVRCLECHCYTPVDEHTGKCVFLIGEHQYVVPDGYCYLGERKEGAD